VPAHRTNPLACEVCGAPVVRAASWLAGTQEERNLWSSWGWKKYGGRGMCHGDLMKANRKNKK